MRACGTARSFGQHASRVCLKKRESQEGVRHRRDLRSGGKRRLILLILPLARQIGAQTLAQEQGTQY
eukprot:COSAG05_NODE_17_length_35518_cov_34.728084_2_plen_67_part_00